MKMNKINFKDIEPIKIKEQTFNKIRYIVSFILLGLIFSGITAFFSLQLFNSFYQRLFCGILIIFSYFFGFYSKQIEKFIWKKINGH